jgi:hypothetical protein
VKARLQHDKLPLKLYDLLKDASPTKIIKEFPEDYLMLLVEMIMRIATGHKELEDELTNVLIKDLDQLQSKRDMYFVNKVLLPMIRTELTVPVCIIERNKSADWAVNIDSLSTGGQSDKAIKADYNKFVPSELIDAEIRPNLIKGFKEVVG